MSKYLIFFVGIFFLTPGSLFAATSDFKISVLSGEDTEPPTTPTLLSVVPVATTQIDIDWTASTDNLMLSGYVLLRDGVQHATTTLTSFEDTGLTPSTLYAYEVYAFDWMGNMSSTSNLLATTTLALPPPVATTTEGTATPPSATKTLRLDDFSITTLQTTATFNWQTNLPVRYTLRWGRTDAYTGGYIVNDTYRSFQQTTVTDLEPGTMYQYELIGYPSSGIASRLRQGQFTTQTDPATAVLMNVSKLNAQVVGQDVLLSWQLPVEASVAAVRVVRNHLGYPSDIFDGAVVYEGLGETFYDKDALARYSPQYYTVFVIGLDGSVSSGAVVLVWRDAGVDLGTGVPPSSTTPPLVPGETLPPELPIFGLDINDIVLIQGEKQFTFLSDGIVLSPHEAFTISIPYEALPEHLKAVVVTLLDPTDQRRSYSFLLRINKLRTAYEATIAPLNVLGVSRLQIEIFDFERMLVGRYRKQIDFVVLSGESSPVLFPDALVSPLRLFGLLLIALIILLCLWWFFYKSRSRATEDNN